MRSEKIIEFIETLRLPDGTSVGRPFVLRDWQKKIIGEVYGPTDAQGKRIVRHAVFSAGRKAGKTAMISAICLCHLTGPEAIQNGQLYSLSVDREQASILFNYAKSMVYMDEELSERLVVIESRKQIKDIISGSVYSVLSGEKKGKMGKSSSFIAFDELSEFGRDRALYDALITSTAAHDEPMTWTFSTQSPDDGAIMSELLDYGEKVRGGEIEDPTFKSFLFTVPDDLDPFDEQNWHLANPSLGDFRSLEEMRDYAAKAKRMPSMQASFENLYLNRRIDAAEHFISSAIWKANGSEPDLSVFEDVECFGGLDLSAKNDLTVLILVAEDSEKKIHVWPFFWSPADNMREREEKDSMPYNLWASQGHLTAVPGKTIDYRYVARQIAELMGKVQISSVKFDRWRIADMQRAMVEEGMDAWIEGQDSPVPGGLKLISHGQGFKDMNSALECLEDALIEERIRHGNHPVLTMCAGNSRVQPDAAGNRKFDKIKSTGRIDGIVALAMALNGAQTESAHVSAYENRGVLVF
ncbi:terminase large subunit [Desulfonatronovibrio magnus]|uniref:terminase large subunit n=1 Tax=Desulfonatronovibrio magnus TaxID=698827 RepID=UPI0005EB124D|nr:terminase TerL endonuclease subunit [Desulfonatronovibrio magnus]